MMPKCGWALSSAIEETYHDHEWGVPLHDDRQLFEFLVLEGAQAGLSWRTILSKRDAYRQALDDFDPQTIAGYNDIKIETLMRNVGIVRNRLKIQATIYNAKAFLKILEHYDSFDRFIWQFVNGSTLQNHWKTPAQIPTSSKESIAMSKALKQAGFKFVGATICYAYMQAVGMVNDHTVDCFRHAELGCNDCRG
ncbi:MAG: hypothetical protein RL563_2579 [Pseudomonadota bacterium]|jgi:DNA-3-methyladenine glycosylase I